MKTFKMLVHLAKIQTVVAVILSINTGWTQTSKKPNVVFILIDDFGWNDVGYNGSTFYETPHLDQLSKEFMRFDRCYTPSPMCSPTRVSIITGKNPARHGVTQWLPGRANWPGKPKTLQKVLCPAPQVSGINRNETTLAEALQKVGYDTGFFGKWHMGKFSETGDPSAHGFATQKAVIEENSCAMFYPFKDHKEYFPEAVPGDNFTDLLTESAIEFIDKKRSEPFFLYLSHFAMHAPIASKKEELQKFTEKAKLLPNLSKEEKKIKDPYAHKPYNSRQDSPDYAGELATLDENIGKLVQHLKDSNQFENTIIIITGDNGGRTSFFHSPPTAVMPLRGGKTFNFDGGLRTPLLIHCPGITRPNQQDSTVITSIDFYPTILEMIGQPLLPNQHQDGVSLVPLMKDKTIEKRNVYWHFPHYQGEGSYPTSAIMDGAYKLIVNYHQEDVLLFNVFEDIGETHNLAKSMPDKVLEMQKNLSEYLKSTNALIPKANPDYVHQ
ncbi:sulfatase [Aquimarina sp. ERC-38]|uniref:sulfatase n=1 Tax=Aquimarina sp. ERC-38 TaxID=2949996 RepID=UPI0022482C75|nr:sulfatase [Aquimarina sp. ERC-38]UZO80292.1 sulfatase [Aquimarina sp. ERC-38]